MTPSTPTDSSFAYRAETPAGQLLSGTLDSPTPESASSLLQSLGLRILALSPVHRRLTPGPLRGEDFVTFNQQLAQLTAAGLPVEHGLRLIAKDVRSGRLAATINAVAADLEAGTPLPQAFEKHRRQFPTFYGRLIDAGVRANNLPSLLLNLGRHAQLVQRMRAMVWEALAYPLIVLLVLVLLLAFLGLFVLPSFEVIFKDFRIQLPAITVLVLTISQNMRLILGVLAAVVLAVPVIAAVLRAAGLGPAAYDALIVPLPIIGPPLRRNLIARWCDAMSTAVSAGLDLPAAIALSGDAVGSPAVRADGAALIARLQAGQSPQGAALRVLPATVPVILDLGPAGKDLPGALDTLGQMYQQQAELRLTLIPALLTPILFLLIGAVIGFVILALFAPMISLIQSVSGPWK